MSSVVLVSLCVIRIEIIDPDIEETANSMAARKIRGCREPRDITVETYANITEGPIALLSSSSPTTSSSVSGSSKSYSSSRPNSEEKTITTNVVDTIEGATSIPSSSSSSLLLQTDQINFISGNPFVEVTKGILHLYKEDELTKINQAAKRSNTICILSVPATMTCHDLLTFTAACHQDIQYFRIIKDNNPNQYMALITMRSSTAASEFYGTYNGAPYNSLEPDVVCHMVFVSRVEINDNGMSINGHTELPSCPVCLERMDESVDGILTILCNHTFHSSCLVKWGDISCPVCRYAQTPEPLGDSHCMECITDTNNDALWICLICGHIGCSRYHEGHAFEHYRDTHHCYAMQLGNNRVWDYVGDNFVHRLLQDKDGKMVEGGQETLKCDDVTDVDEKVDAVQLEFTYLLTSQLETQRQYFEDRLNRIEQRSLNEITELKEKLNKLTNDNIKINEKLITITKEKQINDKKLQNSNIKFCQTQKELNEEKALRKSLELNQTSWQTKFKLLEKDLLETKNKKEQEINNLREQVRDLMFFLEAQNQIEKSADKNDIVGGTIFVPETSTNSNNDTSTRSRRHRNKH